MIIQYIKSNPCRAVQFGHAGCHNDPLRGVYSMNELQRNREK